MLKTLRVLQEPTEEVSGAQGVLKPFKIPQDRSPPTPFPCRDHLF